MSCDKKTFYKLVTLAVAVLMMCSGDMNRHAKRPGTCRQALVAQHTTASIFVLTQAVVCVITVPRSLSRGKYCNFSRAALFNGNMRDDTVSTA